MQALAGWLTLVNLMKNKRKRPLPSAPVPPALLSHQVLVRLLEMDLQQNALIDNLQAHDIDLAVLRVDLIDIVLDAMQVPADNTIEQKKKYGLKKYKEHPDTFCRSDLIEKWCETNQRTRKQIEQYLLWVQEQLAICWS